MTTGLRSSSWHDGVKSSRRVGVRPTGVLAGTLMVLAALVTLAVAGWGVKELSLLWAGVAVLAVVGMLVLTLRGFPLFAILTVVGGAVAWGAASRGRLPEGWTDFFGLLKFIGINLAFVVPLVGAFLAALMLDARRMSRAAIDEAVSGRRWWGEPDDHLPRLKELEVLPSARFFALGEGGCTHLVVAGRRVALFLPTVWPHGEFTMDEAGQVLRGGRLFVPGSEDVDGLAAEVHTWREQLGKVGGQVRGYLVVAPSRGDVSEDLVISVAPGEHLQLVHAHEMVEAAGRWLAAEPYRVELSVMERLLVIASGSQLPEPSPFVRTFGAGAGSRNAPGALPTDAAFEAAVSRVTDSASSAAVEEAVVGAGAIATTGALRRPESIGVRRGRLGRFGRAGDRSVRAAAAPSSGLDSPVDAFASASSGGDLESSGRGDFEPDGSIRARFGRRASSARPDAQQHRTADDPRLDGGNSWESRATRELVGAWDTESASKLAAWAADTSPAEPGSSDTSRDSTTPDREQLAAWRSADRPSADADQPGGERDRDPSQRTDSRPSPDRDEAMPYHHRSTDDSDPFGLDRDDGSSRRRAYVDDDAPTIDRWRQSAPASPRGPDRSADPLAALDGLADSLTAQLVDPSLFDPPPRGDAARRFDPPPADSTRSTDSFRSDLAWSADSYLSASTDPSRSDSARPGDSFRSDSARSSYEFGSDPARPADADPARQADSFGSDARRRAGSFGSDPSRPDASGPPTADRTARTDRTSGAFGAERDRPAGGSFAAERDWRATGSPDGTSTPGSRTPRPTPRRTPGERPSWGGSLFDETPELVAPQLELRRSWETDPTSRSIRRRDRQQPHPEDQHPSGDRDTTGSTDRGAGDRWESAAPSTGDGRDGSGSAGTGREGWGVAASSPGGDQPDAASRGHDRWSSAESSPSGPGSVGSGRDRWGVAASSTGGDRSASEGGGRDAWGAAASSPGGRDRSGSVDGGHDWAGSTDGGRDRSGSVDRGRDGSGSAGPSAGRAGDRWDSGGGGRWESAGDGRGRDADVASSGVGRDSAGFEASEAGPGREPWGSAAAPAADNVTSIGGRRERWDALPPSAGERPGRRDSGAEGGGWESAGPRVGDGRAGSAKPRPTFTEQPAVSPPSSAWPVPAADEGPAWWDADAAKGGSHRNEEPPAEQPSAKRSRWGWSKSRKGGSAEAPAEKAEKAEHSGAAVAEGAGGDFGDAGGRARGDWATDSTTRWDRATASRSAAADRPAWATDPTSGFDSDDSGEFVDDRRSSSRPAFGRGSEPRGRGGEPGGRGGEPGWRGVELGTRSGEPGADMGGRGGEPDWRGVAPDARGSEPGRRGADPGGRGEEPGWRGGEPGGPGGEPGWRGGDPGGRGGEPGWRGGEPGGRGVEPGGRGVEPGGRGSGPGAWDRPRAEAQGDRGSLPDQRAKALPGLDDEVAPLELNLDEEPRQGRRFLRRK